ncbi:MAG: hypothetical protein ACREV7_16665 [Steroidobacteraceae bacterium]
MWKSLPWFVRLAIDIVAGIVVLGAALLLVVAFLWLIGGTADKLFSGALSRRALKRQNAALKRHKKYRKSLGYDE